VVDPGLQSARQAVTGDIRGAATTALGAAASVTKEGAGDILLYESAMHYTKNSTVLFIHICIFPVTFVFIFRISLFRHGTDMLSSAASIVKTTTVQGAGTK